MCVGLPKPAEHLVLAALFFGPFFCASKRKDKQFISPRSPLDKTKKRKETKKNLYCYFLNILYWSDERRNNTDNEGIGYTKTFSNPLLVAQNLYEATCIYFHSPGLQLFLCTNR